ncbi:DMT family transporter [Desulfovibrio sp.]|uniref:DMT family transporter n=1 Tax=Desulfovibrio sp. TaxID=885 RepID=UPI0023BEEA0D|nr:DMT family transporter [Desulfovibrio sp.]MDE7242183.1 DMT family transporter [Desulfovibrio sp.]
MKSASAASFRASGQVVGHLVALATIIVWGVTFISTKMLLVDFSPTEILLLRFLLGWLALWLVCPHRLMVGSRKDELLFALAGLSGVSIYFLLENVALTLTFASNVGVIVAVAPFFTALLAWRFLGAARPGPVFCVGFAVAITGIACISLAGSELALNPAWDVLALLAALSWAVYSIVVRMLAARGYGSLPATRRIFFYGLVCMLPILPFTGISLRPEALLRPVNWANLLFLGLCASALCFVTWTYCVRLLGAVKASLYIYLVPVVTVITSIALLDERVTWLSGAGMALTLAGLLISERGTAATRGEAQEREAPGEGQA